MMGQLNPRLYELAMHKLCTGQVSVTNVGIHEDNYKHISDGYRWIALFWNQLRLTRSEVEAWYGNERPAGWYETAAGWLS